jgi:hypothetical protein
MGHGKGVALRFLGGTCRRLGDSCGRAELPRRDADEALEVTAELALVREAGAGGRPRQGQVAALLQPRLGPLADDPSKSYGPFAFAVPNAVAMGWLLRGQGSHPNKPVTG